MHETHKNAEQSKWIDPDCWYEFSYERNFGFFSTLAKYVQFFIFAYVALY